MSTSWWDKTNDGSGSLSSPACSGIRYIPLLSLLLFLFLLALLYYQFVLECVLDIYSEDVSRKPGLGGAVVRQIAWPKQRPPTS